MGGGICTWALQLHLRLPTSTALGLPSIPQLAKQSLDLSAPFATATSKTPRKFVEHVKSQGHKDKAKEVTPAPSEDRGPGGAEPGQRPHSKLRCIQSKIHSRAGGIGALWGVRWLGCRIVAAQADLSPYPPGKLKTLEKDVASQDEDLFITVDAVGCFERR